jgi:hypothetical protein
MKARGLDTDGKALCLLMMRRTVANLQHWSVERGAIRSMPGPGQEYVWEIVRLQRCYNHRAHGSNAVEVAKTLFCH